jgi:prolyl-tRNA synthetase
MLAPLLPPLLDEVIFLHWAMHIFFLLLQRPKEVAPFDVHLLELDTDASEIYDNLQKEEIKVLYDNREKSAGEKLSDCDLIGIPIRIILSKKTLEKDCVEIKKRGTDELELVKIKKLTEFIQNEL